MPDIYTKKSLGQHWLKDQATLKAIVNAAGVAKDDTVLEIGPGLGTLTQELVKAAHKVIAVEFDEFLAGRLDSSVAGNNLTVIHQDILKFDLSTMPLEYKVVANIPYYLTGQLMRVFTESANLPDVMVLLVQKEVAERIAAKSGEMSILSVSAQLEYEVKLGSIVNAELFTPPPKVDSQVVILTKRQKPLFEDLSKGIYMRLVKAGFSARRKKLRGSLSAGLAIDKTQSDELLKQAKIDGNLRAQNLSLKDWHKLYNAFNESISKT
jgi:16S rRNA (adenine1518-N6/adenine1519-N6)-dimethyltransferase